MVVEFCKVFRQKKTTIFAIKCIKHRRIGLLNGFTFHAMERNVLKRTITQPTNAFSSHLARRLQRNFCLAVNFHDVEVCGNVILICKISKNHN